MHAILTLSPYAVLLPSFGDTETMASSPSLSNQGQLKLLFVRHGETQDNIDRVLQGHRDTSLTEKGQKEAQILAKKLRALKVDAIYHSPLIRILQTIKPLLSDHPNARVHEDAELRGQLLGTLEGGSYDLIDMTNPRSADGRPGVELFDDFVRRIRRAFARIVGAEAPELGSNDRTVVIAMHGVNITSLFKALEDSPPCNGFNAQIAFRGPAAHEVRWTDSDDVAEIVVEQPAELPVGSGSLAWDDISGQPFRIVQWGKKEKAV